MTSLRVVFSFKKGKIKQGKAIFGRKSFKKGVFADTCWILKSEKSLFPFYLKVGDFWQK